MGGDVLPTIEPTKLEKIGYVWFSLSFATTGQTLSVALTVSAAR